MVTWKDALTGVWHGPDPVLAWARGTVCVFPQHHLDLGEEGASADGDRKGCYGYVWDPVPAQWRK